MKPFTIFSRSLFLFVLVVNVAAASRGRTIESKEASSVRHFVQTFYNWYVVAEKADQSGPMWDRVLNPKRSGFSPTLLKALHEDAVASAKSKDGIVGLDFDPFLASQDPADHYYVGKVEQKGSAWLVSLSSEKPTAKPIVIAKLEKHNGHWQFTNFLYPDGGNLLQLLKDLKKDRK